MKEQISTVNGVKICSTLNSNLNSFCLSFYFRGGSLFESSSNNGISHLFEHIVFRNLKNKYDNFYELLSIHGIVLQGCTYKEFIRFTLNGPCGEFEFASEILCSIFDSINLPKSEFESTTFKEMYLIGFMSNLNILTELEQYLSSDEQDNLEEWLIKEFDITSYDIDGIDD